MKLNLWMIANRLYQMEPEMYIPEDAPANLKSARLSSTPQCVYVYQQENDVICDAGEEGGFLIFREDNYKQIFNVIQATFDFYQDWEESLIRSGEHMDYEGIMRKSWLVFHNPMVLLDGSNKVLSMSSQYENEIINNDWTYLKEHGHSSVRIIEYLMNEGRNNKYYLNRNAQIYYFNNPDINISMISYAIFLKEKSIGRLNVLEYERKLNIGDIQLVEFVSGYLVKVLGKVTERTEQTGQLTHYFIKMILGQKVTDTELEYWKQYVKWSEQKEYRVCVLALGEKVQIEKAIYIRNLIQNSVPQVLAGIYEETIVFTVSDTQMQNLYRNKILDDLRQYVVFRAGLSLPFSQVSEIPHMYKQACIAVQYGESEEILPIIDFYTCAVRYMVEHVMDEAFFYACHPDIRKLFVEFPGDKQIWETYFVYLKNNNSVSAAARELKIHKNTLRYRINKIEEVFQYNDMSSYTREYMLLSMYIIFLENAKNNKTDE